MKFTESSLSCHCFRSEILLETTYATILASLDKASIKYTKSERRNEHQIKFPCKQKIFKNIPLKWITVVDNEKSGTWLKWNAVGFSDTIGKELLSILNIPHPINPKEECVQGEIVSCYDRSDKDAVLKVLSYLDSPSSPFHQQSFTPQPKSISPDKKNYFSAEFRNPLLPEFPHLCFRLMFYGINTYQSRGYPLRLEISCKAPKEHLSRHDMEKAIAAMTDYLLAIVKSINIPVVTKHKKQFFLPIAVKPHRRGRAYPPDGIDLAIKWAHEISRKNGTIHIDRQLLRTTIFLSLGKPISNPWLTNILKRCNLIRLVPGSRNQYTFSENGLFSQTIPSKIDSGEAEVGQNLAVQTPNPHRTKELPAPFACSALR